MNSVGGLQVPAGCLDPGTSHSTCHTRVTVNQQRRGRHTRITKIFNQQHTLARKTHTTNTSPSHNRDEAKLKYACNAGNPAPMNKWDLPTPFPQPPPHVCAQRMESSLCSKPNVLLLREVAVRTRGAGRAPVPRPTGAGAKVGLPSQAAILRRGHALHHVHHSARPTPVTW